MKKIKSALLAAVIAIQALSIPTVSAIETKVYINESFNNVATNAQSDEISVSGSSNNRVVEESETNKTLRLDLSKGRGSVSVPVDGQEDIMWFGIRYKSSHRLQRAALFKLNGSSGDSNTPITVTSDGGTIAYGKPINLFNANSWNDVAVKVNFKKQTYDIYIDGKAKVSDWLFESKVSNILTVDFEFGPVSGNASGAFVDVDDIRVWSGNYYLNAAKNGNILKESVSFSETEEDAEINFFAANDFETSTDGILLNFQSSGYNPNCKMELAQEENGNHYFMYELTSGQGGYFEINAKNSNGRTPDYIIFEFDMKVYVNEGSPITFMDIRDQNLNWSHTDYYSADGKFYVTDGNRELPIKTGDDWVKLDFAYNLISHTIDVYADKKLLYENIPMQNPNFGVPLYARIQMQTVDIPLKMGFDNLYVYEAEKPIDDPESKAKGALVSTFATDVADAQSFLGKNTVFCVDSGAVYRNKVRYPGVGKGVIVNDRTLIPVRTLSEAFDLDVTWDQEARQVHIGNDVVMTIDDPKIKRGSSTITSDVPPMIINERTYLPLRILAEQILGQNVVWDDSGLVFMNEGEIKYSKPDRPDEYSTADMDKFGMAYRYLMYDRMSGNELVEAMTGAPRPRLLCDADKIDVIRDWVTQSDLANEWFENAKKTAEEYLSWDPIPYNVSGGRIDRARTREEMIITLSLLYRVTGEEKYAEKAWQELENISNYPNWWPQHALETGALLIAASVGYDWLYDWLGGRKTRCYCRSDIRKGTLRGTKNIFNSKQRRKLYKTS